MNTDRELLELAAKAAGIEGKWTEWDHAYGDYRERGIDYGGQALWNPIADDGDALRLAVKLKLDVCRDFDRIDVVYGDEDEFVSEYLHKLSTDPCAATRRAIVRAAAEIGRRMK